MEPDNNDPNRKHVRALALGATAFYLGVWLSRSGFLDWLGVGQFIVPEMLIVSACSGLIFGFYLRSNLS